MSNQQLMVLIGSIVAIIGLFVPAVNGLTPTGINNHETLNIMQQSDGIIFLVLLVITTIFSFVANKAKIGSYIGIVGLILAILDLKSTMASIDNIIAQFPMGETFISISYGYFVLLLGTLIISVGIFAKTASNAKVVQTTSVADELEKLSKLKERGVITDDEFTQQKEQLLK